MSEDSIAMGGFKVGDIVVLKSGGPDMTVEQVGIYNQPDTIECQWFGGRKLESGRFPKDSLQHVPEKPKAG